MSSPLDSELPVEQVLPEIRDALSSHGAAVLQAEPGAGKTTRVPLALMDEPWLDGGRIVMLEPRRVAARAAAHRLAQQLNSRVGDVVGHRMRDDTKVSSRTRVEVVTEGVLTRMIQSDPSLAGVGAVLFDEFHERSLHADLGLALVIEAREALRDDLRVLVMSATLDVQRVAGMIGGAPVVSSQGRSHSVETLYRPPARAGRVEEHAAAVVLDVLGCHDGDVLVFLPGAGWIRRTERHLADRLPPNVVITPLHGRLPGAAQDRAIQPDPSGRRKVVLATDIAETSLTIDGVRVVVDTGQRRAPRYDARSGLTRLETRRISVASADQRRGRAGRQAPGVCYRLWAESETAVMDAFDLPEIRTADLSALRLELARWGAAAHELAWLDAPPARGLAEAEELLVTLGALDGDGRITDHGAAMLDLGGEPRIAHMLVRATELGLGPVACDVAAILAGRDPLESRSTDIRDRITALAHGGSKPIDQARSASARWRRRLGVGDERADADGGGAVVALAFTDRIGQQRGAPDSYRLASGRGAALPPGDPLSGQPFLAVADVEGDPARGRIHLAAPLDRADLDLVAKERIERRPVVEWDSTAGDVVAEHRTTLGALVLKREPMTEPPAGALAEAWADAVADLGLDLLPFTKAVDEWRARVALVRSVLGDTWPDLSDEALSGSTHEWLAPHLNGVRRRRDLGRLDMGQVLRARLDWSQGRRLDELAPTHVRVPSGSSIRVDYTAPDGPVLAVRLQEMFGLDDTPAVVDGRVPLVVHLLSPAQRPVQVTTDLASFWRNGYPQVRAELRGRYPKHHWPEDPVTATPTARVKPRSRD